MKEFYRSLRYLKPYTKRLIASVVLVLLIAVLWGGGLGMLLPGMKILMSDEGLHGWAWASLTESKLGVTVIRRNIPLEMQRTQHLPATVIQVVSVKKGSPAAAAGIKDNDWVISDKRVGPGDPETALVPAESLLRHIALDTPSDTPSTLMIYREHGNRKTPYVPVTITPADPSSSSRLLGEVAQRIHEPQSRAERFPLLLYLLLVVGAMTVLRNLCRFFQEYLVQTAVYRAMMDIRCENYNISLKLPVSYYAQHGVTDSMSRFIQDTNQVARAQNTLFGKTLVEPAKMIASIGIALWFSWELTLVAMIAGPIVYVLIRKFGKVMKRSSKRALESWADMLAVLEETLAGIRVVKAYTMEAAERKRFFRVNRTLYKSQRRIARIDSGTGPIVESLGMLAGGVAAGFAGYYVFQGTMDPDIFVAWMAASAAMFDPMRKLSKVATRFQAGQAGAERIFELHDRTIEKRVLGAPALAPMTESLVFENVWFTYPNANKPSVSGANLSIQAGQNIAIVGPNGSGKTTLVSLLPRLLVASEGRILIDGTDIAGASLRSLRAQIGYVTQETVIFNATVYENIAYGLRRPNREQILDASRRAFVDEFAMEMPDGYDTIIGQRGATLSGGQRQRIAIARAILRDPAILIFDEALSQIDADSEARITEAMTEFVKGRTTLTIAHRFSTIRSADAILVMDAGAVIDTGTHDELQSRCKLYQHLYQTQLIEDDA